MEQIREEQVKILSTILFEKFGHASVTQVDRAVADILKKTNERQARGDTFSWSRAIRGMLVEASHPLCKQTAEADLQYVKALTTGSTPGSYLIPTIQADTLIQMLATGGLLRASGCRIWPMAGIQKMTVPAALTSPTWVFMAQNSQQTSTDPNLAQISFDLKRRQCLIGIPNELLAASVPAFDTLLSELIGLAAAENEDQVFFASSTISNSPQAIMSAAGISVINSFNGNANGGPILYGDLLAVLAKAAAVKAKGPFAWYASPRTFFQRVLGLLDLQSRPIVIPTLVQGLAGAVNFTLLGYPVYVSPFISETETLVSGTNLSHMIFTNPKYLHIGEDAGGIEIAISLEFAFSANQTTLRGSQHLDGAVAPAAGVVVLQGIS